MTSYGQGAKDAPGARVFIEIHTVNKKNLEINCYMPREMRRFESLMRSQITQAISSGQVTLHVQTTFHKDAPIRLAAHLPFAKQLQQEYEKIQEHLGLDKEPITLALLARHNELWAVEENQGLLSEVEPILLAALKEALENCLMMKREEGAALKKDLVTRIKTLKELTASIQKIAEKEPARYREKLTELYEKLKIASLDEERILREIALFSEKIDISEEITRLLSHCSQFENLLESHEAVGKTLDFLSQEIQRETNTIASKSQNIEITRHVVTMKTEVSRIREQVMNVE